MHPSSHVGGLRAARLTMRLSWAGVAFAQIVGWGTFAWVMTSNGPRPHVEDALAGATIATFLFNAAAVGAAVVSLVTGWQRRSPWPALGSLALGILGFAGTVGLFFFWGFASIGIK